MQINQQNLAALFRGYRTLFMEEYQAAPPEWEGIAMRTASGSAEEVYHWLGAIPGMKKLVGEVVIDNLTANNWTIPNCEWEDTIGVKQADIERDSHGIYSPLFQSLGSVARHHPDELVADLLLQGFTQPDYTGQPFFASNKVQGSEAAQVTFSNKGTAKLSAGSYETARKNMRCRKNGEGRPMGLGRDLLLIVAPKNETVARQILEAERVSGGDSNVNKGTARLLVWPQLCAGNENAWFLLEVGLPMRPLIVQIEKEPQLASLTDWTTSDHVFKQHEFLYQAYGRYNAGYGLPQLAYGSDGSTAAP